MRGFLSKWFNRKAEDKSLPRSHREQPILLVKSKSHKNPPKNDEQEYVAHPDTEFLDYEDWATENIEAPTAQNTTSRPEELPRSEVAAASDVFLDTEWVDEYQIDASNTHELGIISEYQNSAEERSLEIENQELIEINSTKSETASEYNAATWVDLINDSVVLPNALKGEIDSSGNTYLHLAAMLGSPQFCVQLLKDGWNPEVKNQYGQSAIDLARKNNRENTAICIELYLSKKDSLQGEGGDAAARPANNEKLKEETQRSEDTGVSAKRKLRSHIDKDRKKDHRFPSINPNLGYNYVSEEPGTSSSLNYPNGEDAQKQKASTSHKKMVKLSDRGKFLWNILVRDSRCPKEVWGRQYNCSVTDIAGNTLLHYAVRAGNKSYSLHLISIGWNVLSENNDGDTPLDVAKSEGHIDLVDALYLLSANSLLETTSQKEASAYSSSEDLDTIITSKLNIELLKGPLEKINETTSVEYLGVPGGAIDDGIHELPIDIASQESAPEQTKITLACVKCGVSLSEFASRNIISFCPFCGSEQNVEDAGSEVASNSIGRHLVESGAGETIVAVGQIYSSGEFLLAATDDNTSEQESNHIFEEFSDDVGYYRDGDPNEVDINENKPRSGVGRSFDEQKETSQGWRQSVSSRNQTEEWEIFLDDDLEEQTHPSDQHFEDEDPLEQGRIVEYASRLTSRITSFKSKDRRRIYAFFISILGDFPFYQSYAAIERLIEKDVQIDQIRDAYAVKLIWMTNPNIWSSRRYNILENDWPVSRNPKLKNSMSWQLASDLANSFSPNELENLILNDWYAEWLNLPSHGGDTASGLDPAYSLYSTYLYEKRRLLTSNVNTW
jgi:hypothetical protein